MLVQRALVHEVVAPAVVDDDPGKQGSLLCGVPVVNRQGLQAKAKQGAISTVLLALPTLPRHRRMALVNWLEQLDIRVQTVPTFNDIASGRARLDEIQDVAIEDLLSRCISGKHVLVTGAGGSIGSELCRQIVKLAPARLVLLEQSEVALYDIERELRGLIELSGRDTTLVPMLGSVVNRGHVQRLCRENRIDTLYHAAAYKHVPIVEQNASIGILNNTFGCATRALSISAVPRRWPETLITSSTRPVIQ